MRDFMGNIIKTDMFGNKIPKKQIKRETIEENRRRGRAAEESYKARAQMAGYEVERTGKGHDFRIRKRDMFTGRVTYSALREIKSGNAKLSKLQKETKKNKSNFKVIREDPMFY